MGIKLGNSHLTDQGKKNDIKEHDTKIGVQGGAPKAPPKTLASKLYPNNAY